MKYEALAAMKDFKAKVEVTTGLENINFRIKKAKLNAVVDDEVKQVTFHDLHVKTGREAPVILHNNEYVFLNSVELFKGTLNKFEESKTVEPFLKELIETYEVSSLGAYPPGTMTDYSLLFKLEDLEWVSINDALIINSVNDKLKKQEMIHERSHRKLQEYEEYEILTQLPPSVRVKLDIGVGFVLKELNYLLEYITEELSFLNITEIDSFYFMTPERIQSLDKFLLYNKQVTTVTLKVDDEDILAQLITVLNSHPILNITIQFQGENTPKLKAMVKEFIVKGIDRTIKVNWVRGKEITYTKPHTNQKEFIEEYDSGELRFAVN